MRVHVIDRDVVLPGAAYIAMAHVKKAEVDGYLLVNDVAALLELSSKRCLRLIEGLTKGPKGSPLEPMAAAIKRVFDHTEDIFSGRSDGIEVLRQDDLLPRVYNLTQNCDYGLFVRILSHRTPNLRISEVGAGTGATTDAILKDLVSPYGDRMYSSYVFTDISAGFSAPQRRDSAPRATYTFRR